MSTGENTSSSAGPSTPLRTSTALSSTKSAFLTPCRRMGLKRRSTPGALSTPSPLIALTDSRSRSDSPLAKKRVEESLPRETLDSTPKRKFAPKRRSLVVTRVEKVVTEKEVQPAVVPKEAPLENLKASIQSKKEQIAALQMGTHPMQIETDRLNKLITMWRTGCRSALEDLLEMLKNNSEDASRMLTLSILISNLDIPPDLVHFDPTKDEFY